MNSDKFDFYLVMVIAVTVVTIMAMVVSCDQNNHRTECYRMTKDQGCWTR